MLDDDLFELDEDLLNATDFSQKFDGTVNCDEDISQNIRFLHCTGEDHLNRHLFHEQSFIANDEIKLIESNLKKFHNQKLFDLELSEDVLSDPTILQSLLGKARMNIQTLIVSSRENTTFVTKKSYLSMRQETTVFLFQLRHLLFTGRIKQNVIEDLLRPFSLYLEQLNTLPIIDVLHTIHSTLGNASTSPVYHLLHGHIEWRWIYLTICLRIEQDRLQQNIMISENTLRNTEFEEKLQLFLYDLMLISVAKFNRLHTTELALKSPFTCTCIKEIWLLAQLLIDRLHDNGGQLNSFWHYFDSALSLHRERKTPYATMKQLCISRDTTSVFANDATIFPLWLLNGVATLNGYSENGTFRGADSPRIRENSELLETLLKAFIISEPNEQNLRASLLIVNSLLLNWWPQKSDQLMIFWEYFHKKLNSSFYLSGSTPAALAVVGKTASDYLDQVQKLIDNDNITTDMSSYTMFMNLLGKVLKRLVETDAKNQIMKIIGRIFTKFGESKLNTLTEVGIHNLLTLFLILASVIGAKEIGQRLHSILLQLKLEKLLTARQCCLIKGHMALLILYSKQEVNAQNYVTRLLEQVSKLNTDEHKLPVLRIMIEAVERIFDKSDFFALDEYLLFDSWIVDYLSCCSQTEQEKCLQFINKMFVAIGKDIHLMQQYPEKRQKVIQILYKNVLPFVKQIYRQSNVFGGVPDIAATFCIHANGQNGLANFQELFKHFTEVSCCDVQITAKFLISILTEENLEKVEQIIIIRLWLKCSMLSTGANEDIRQLTKIVLKLSDFQLLCKTTESEMFSAKEPLSVFFASCGQLYESAQDQSKKQISDRLQAALAGFEKWVPISESPPAIFKIHVVIALIIFNCAPIVYVRSKPGCFFTVIMNHYILPLPLLMGKTQKLISIQAVHRIWHLIVGGIEKLDYQSDAQLQKVFTDLIVKWIPQFRLLPIQKIVSKPFITYARHTKRLPTLQFVLEKIVNNFLSAQRRETHQNAPIAVTILTDVLGDVCNETDIVKVILNTTTITLFEHAMMVDENLPSRTMIFDFFGNLFKSPAYISSMEIRSIVTSNLMTLTTKNLSYHSSFFFQFMQKLARINSKCVADVIHHVREQVEHVEKLRNAGTDIRLRNSLRQLEELVRR